MRPQLLPLARGPRLRPWWHVGVPFWIGAVMVGAIGIAGRNPLALLLALVFTGWGLLWALRARQGARHHAQVIAEATALLADPSAEFAIWLGPATLLLRPRRPGHLLWTTEGLAWTATDVANLLDPARRVMTGTCEIDLSLKFAGLAGLEHFTGALRGDCLLATTTDGETYRFRLPDPATYSFVVRACESGIRG